MYVLREAGGADAVAVAVLGGVLEAIHNFDQQIVYL